MHLLQIDYEFNCENYYIGNVHWRHADYGFTAYINSSDGLKVFMSLPQSGRSSDLTKT